eukprot:253400-Prymnesium_polylepis.2
MDRVFVVTGVPFVSGVTGVWSERSRLASDTRDASCAATRPRDQRAESRVRRGSRARSGFHFAFNQSGR